MLDQILISVYGTDMKDKKLTQHKTLYTYNRLDENAFTKLTEGATILKGRTRSRPPVYKQGDQVIKIVKVCNLLHFLYMLNPFCKQYRTRLYSRATRFTSVANFLQQHGIKAPQVNKLYFYPKKLQHIIVYTWLPGKPIDQIYDNRLLTKIVPKIASLAVKLHELGIYCDDFAINNILLQRNSNLALIDIEKDKVYSKPLSLKKRLCNIARITFRGNFDVNLFVKNYAKNYKNPDEYEKTINTHLKLVATLLRAGYRDQQASKAISRVYKNNLSSNQIIKRATRNLNLNPKMQHRVKRRAKKIKPHQKA